MGKVCTFFGHRELYQDIGPQLTQAIISAIRQGYDIFWCGGYGAFDLCAAGTVYRLKKHIHTFKLSLFWRIFQNIRFLTSTIILYFLKA